MRDIQAIPIKREAAIAYLRTASIGQTDRSVALEHQWQVCQDLARERGLRIIRVYADAGVSGLSPRRPALDRVLQEELPHRRAGYLITADDARLARSPILRLALELELGRHSVRFITVSTEKASRSN